MSETTSDSLDLKDIHWLMDMLHTIDVGLVVLDKEYNVHLWNDFMENHSGVKSSKIMGKNLFESFKEIPQPWFKHKAESVFMLKNRAFTIWEQRPYLFHFKSTRPITGAVDYMYQNITLIPLVSSNTEVNHIGIIIYDVTDIAVSKTELGIANSKLESLSRTDSLTQLNNRGYWEDCLEREFSRFGRTGQVSTLVMFDLDHFKQVNDNYGHPMGDEVIRITAEVLQANLRKTDVPGRYGGEEFAAILLDTAEGGGLLVAERLRNQIENMTVNYQDQSLQYTISVGVATISASTIDHKHWIKQADKALYSAKNAGRNRCVVFDEKTHK